MNRRCWTTVIALVGVLATGCKNQSRQGSDSSSGAAGAAVPDTGDYWAGLKDYLKKGDSLNLWLTHLQDAVCQLEEKSQVQLDNKRRTCPPVQGGGEVKPPPAYPPK